MRNIEEVRSTENRSVLKKARRRNMAKQDGKCDRCPPHGGENAHRQPKDDRHKDHRRIRREAEEHFQQHAMGDDGCSNCDYWMKQLEKLKHDA